MRKIFVSLFLLLVFSIIGNAQNNVVVGNCATIPAIPAGTQSPAFVNVNGLLCTSAVASGGNAAAGAVGSAPPSQASYTAGLLLSTGFLRGVTVTNTAGSTIGMDVNIVGGAAAGGTSSNFNAAQPASGTAIGAFNGTNMVAPRSYDADLGAGTENTLGVVLRKSVSGGSVELGTATDPINVTGISTGNTTQLAGNAIETNSGNGGAGSQRFFLAINQPNLTTALNVAPTANSTVDFNRLVGATPTVVNNKLGVVVFSSDGSTISPTTDNCDGTAPLVKRYITTGTGDNESEVKSSAGTLCAIQARNANATVNAFIKCTNATAASTTPGSTAVFYDMMVPFGGGYVNATIHAPFTTALTCYVVTGKADNDATDVAADDVSYFLTYQ